MKKYARKDDYSKGRDGYQTGGKKYRGRYEQRYETANKYDSYGGRGDRYNADPYENKYEAKTSRYGGYPSKRSYKPTKYGGVTYDDYSKNDYAADDYQYGKKSAAPYSANNYGAAATSLYGKQSKPCSCDVCYCMPGFCQCGANCGCNGLGNSQNYGGYGMIY